MKFYCGIDGGGTKTHCVIGDENKIISEAITGSSNYHIIGIKRAKNAILNSFKEALKKAGIEKKDISFSVLGLSGADRKDDIDFLTKNLSDIFKNFIILNDCWIALKNGVKEYTGIVAICGTGGGYAGRTKDKREFIYRNLDYLTGNRGGAIEIVEKALHFAFRSEEGSYKKTLLEEKIPEIFNVKNMEEVLEKIWGKCLQPEIIAKISPLVFELSGKNDRVCIEIIEELGKTIGEYINGIYERLKFNEKKIKCVLSGGVFKSQNSILLSSIKKELHFTPEFVIPFTPPVYGAYLLARDYSIDFS